MKTRPKIVKDEETKGSELEKPKRAYGNNLRAETNKTSMQTRKGLVTRTDNFATKKMKGGRPASDKKESK